MSATILAFDYGSTRTGVAVFDGTESKPLLTINNNDLWDQIKKLCENHSPDILVVGLPRNMDGEDTQQTYLVRDFANELANKTSIEVALQDEAVSSQRALEKLPKKITIKKTKEVIDQLAAQVILEDYLESKKDETR